MNIAESSDELMCIADGRTTIEETRTINAASKKKSRAIKSAGRAADFPDPIEDE